MYRLANTKFIAAFGALKDQGQAIHGLAFAYEKSGAAPDHKTAFDLALKALGKTSDDAQRIHHRCAARYHEITDSGLLEALRKEIAG